MRVLLDYEAHLVDDDELAWKISAGTIDLFDLDAGAQLAREF